MSQRKKNHRRNIIFKLNGQKNTTYLNMWVIAKQCSDGKFVALKPILGTKKRVNE